MERTDREKLLDARKSLERSAAQVIGATGKLLEPLKDLTDAQQNAVVMLGRLIQGVALLKRPSVKMKEEILVQFRDELDEICPPLGKMAISKDPCFEATVAYASALVKCEAQGVGEDDCLEAWGPLSQAVRCAMRAIEEMKAEFETMLGGQYPPRPIPWPTEQPQK
jgi:hypothetical protein